MDVTYKGKLVEFVDCQGAPVASELPCVLYVARAEMVGPRGLEAREAKKRRIWFEVSRTPFRTNLSNRELTHGWLGCTNNIDRDAHGRVRLSVDNCGRARVRAIREAL